MEPVAGPTQERIRNVAGPSTLSCAGAGRTASRLRPAIPGVSAMKRLAIFLDGTWNTLNNSLGRQRP